MGRTYPEIDDKLADWIHNQHLFFVASAPLAGDGMINCSPKGLDSFAILDSHTVAYLDFNGSGVETIAHLRENGRIIIMFCAFEGAPKIVRLHGFGRSIEPHEDEFAKLCPHFPAWSTVRSVIHVDVNHISDSCGFGVPLYEYVGERDALTKWVASKSPEDLADYQLQKNCRSLDGLPGLKSTAATVTRA